MGMKPEALRQIANDQELHGAGHTCLMPKAIRMVAEEIERLTEALRQEKQRKIVRCDDASVDRVLEAFGNSPYGVLCLTTEIMEQREWKDDLATARETNARLNRRCQEAESTVRQRAAALQEVERMITATAEARANYDRLVREHKSLVEFAKEQEAVREYEGVLCWDGNGEPVAGKSESPKPCKLYRDANNFEHDMAVGPCACGAWHTKDSPPPEAMPQHVCGAADYYYAVHEKGLPECPACVANREKREGSV